ncbi:hypothetical protein Tco_0863878, partial [Tanacetum coccineum]
MDDPNNTIEEYIRLEEEKAQKHSKVYNWKTAMYGKIWYDEDVYDPRSIETEFPVIVYNDVFTSEVTPSCEPTISPLNDNKIDFRISFDESDDEDYMVIEQPMAQSGTDLKMAKLKIMSPITAQQTKLDLELVLKENRLDIEKCNGRIHRGLTPREPTFQVILDAIAFTPWYPAFLITADVPEIFPRVLGRDFDALPSEEDNVSFLRELGHTGEINSLNDVVVDQLSGKTSGLEKLRLSRAQILWGMFHQKNVDYVELLWEYFIYQIEKKSLPEARKNVLPSFHPTKELTQIYGDILAECLTSPAMKESKAYKSYLSYATGAVPPKIARKFKKASPSKKDSDLVPID